MGFDHLGHESVPLIRDLRAGTSIQNDDGDLPVRKSQLLQSYRKVPDIPDEDLQTLREFLKTQKDLAQDLMGSQEISLVTTAPKNVIAIVHRVFESGNSALELRNKYCFDETEAGILFTIYCNNLNEA